MRGFIFLLLFLALPLHAAPAPAKAPQAQDICAGREGCRLLWSEAAGRDEKGRELVVSELVLPFKNEHDRCRRPQDNRFGAFIDNVQQEIWLSTYGGLLPEHKKLFGLCNNGYGAAGMGEDKIDIAENALTHREFGGDNQRWMGGHRFRLAPFAITATVNCGTHTEKGGGRYYVLDYETGAYRDVWNSVGDESSPGDFIACEQTDLGNVESRYRGMILKKIYSFAGIKLDEVKKLGTCATRMTAAEGPQQGFLTYGQNDGSALELAALRINDDRLWVDVSDKGRDFVASSDWQNDDRLEIWWQDRRSLEKEGQRSRKALRQFAIRLADLKVFPGYGYGSHKLALPEVERRDSKEGLRFMVIWPRDQFPAEDGFTLTLAHGDGSKTRMAFSTSALRYGDPDSLGHTINIQEMDRETGLGCKMDGEGLLNIIAPQVGQ